MTEEFDAAMHALIKESSVKLHDDIQKLAATPEHKEIIEETKKVYGELSMEPRDGLCFNSFCSIAYITPRSPGFGTLITYEKAKPRSLKHMIDHFQIQNRIRETKKKVGQPESNSNT